MQHLSYLTAGMYHVTLLSVKLGTLTADSFVNSSLVAASSVWPDCTKGPVIWEHHHAGLIITGIRYTLGPYPGDMVADVESVNSNQMKCGGGRRSSARKSDE